MHFIAVYTHACKDYCDYTFFSRVRKLGGHLEVVDNTPGLAYTKKLKKAGLRVEHIEVPREPTATLFLRNVTQSVNLLRDKFLESKYEHFVIIESDVLPPPNLLNLFDEAASKAEDWAAIGGLYYHGFHNLARRVALEKTHHVLSGCTMYNRDMLQIFNFRYDMSNPGAFPDAWWSHDINHKTDKKLYNYPKIVCQHLHDGKGGRGQRKIYDYK